MRFVARVMLSSAPAEARMRSRADVPVLGPRRSSGRRRCPRPTFRDLPTEAMPGTWGVWTDAGLLLAETRAARGRPIGRSLPMQTCELPRRPTRIGLRSCCRRSNASRWRHAPAGFCRAGVLLESECDHVAAVTRRRRLERPAGHHRDGERGGALSSARRCRSPRPRLILLSRQRSDEPVGLASCLRRDPPRGWLELPRVA